MKKKMLLALGAAVLIFAGCSSGRTNESASAPINNVSPNLSRSPIDEINAQAAGAADTSYSSSATLISGTYAPTQSDKIILSGYVSLQAEKADFDTAMSRVKSEALIVGGYIEVSSLNQGSALASDGSKLRTYSATIRVPSENYEQAWNDIQTFASVQNSNESQQNVTQQYYDTQSRLETKQVEEQRVLALIGQATDVNDLLNLENMLAGIRQDIAAYQSQLTNIDRLASFSTISVDLAEVEKITQVRVDENLGDKMKNGFTDSANATLHFLQGFTVFIAYISVPLVILAILTALGILIFRATNKSKESV